MKRIIIYLILLSGILMSSCDRNGIDPKNTLPFPRALIVSTGNEKGIGELPSGVLIAQRFFESKGVMVSIEPRDVLYQPDLLAECGIIILSTAASYHDADRLFSLSFMSDLEIDNLASWVADGGVLVAGDNVARNFMNGYDRISEFGSLNRQTWLFSEVFGLELKERNLRDFHIHGSLDGGREDVLLSTRTSDFWALVSDSCLSDETEVWAWWAKDSLKYPAITKHSHLKGNAVLLASSYFLHPANEGGFSGIAQIEGFYRRILDLCPGYTDRITPRAWPSGAEIAFAVTVTSVTGPEEVEKLAGFSRSQDIPLTFFYRADQPGFLTSDELKPGTELASGAYDQVDYRDLNFSDTRSEILRNETHAGRAFKGFRFPFRRQSYWGLLALSEQGYLYDSSIPVDQVDRVWGSVFPYYLPVSSRGYFNTLQLLELCPVAKGDQDFFGDFSATENPLLLQKRSMLYGAWLERYRSEVAQAYGGMMILDVDPGKSFRNDTTSYPIRSLIDSLQEQDIAWFCTLQDLAERWNNYQGLVFRVSDNENKTVISIEGPDNASMEGFTFRLKEKPASVSASMGNAKLKEQNGLIYLVCDGINGQKIRISW